MLTYFRIVQALLLVFIILSFPVDSNAQRRWLQQTSGSSAQLNCVHFADNYTGIVCGNDGTLLRTTNGGFNWTNVSFGSTSCFAAKFWNTQIAFLSAAEGYYKSSNGGLNWTLIANTGYFAYKIFIFGNLIMFVSFDNIYKSTNLGDTWTSISVSNGGYGWNFVNENLGWNVGAQYYPPPNPNENIYNRIYRTTNGGSNMTLLSSITSQYQPMYQEICFINENTGYIAGLYGTRKSTNGGTSWSVVNPNLGMHVFVRNADTLYVAQMSNGLVLSTNGGTNWQNDTIDARINDLYFVDRVTGWAVGNEGRIFVSTGALIGMHGLSEASPNQFMLGQNYPNPFNPTTLIIFDLPVSGIVRLAVYDVLGSRVDLLVNEYMEAGSHHISFDGSSLAAGVYFYKLETTRYSETRKMMLIK